VAGGATKKLEEQQKEIRSLRTQMSSMRETIDERDLIASRNGVDALVTSDTDLASQMLADELEQLSHSVRGQLDEHRDEQSSARHALQSTLDAAERRIDELVFQHSGLKEDVDSALREIKAEMVANQTRFGIEVADHQQSMHRITSQLHESEIDSKITFKEQTGQIESLLGRIDELEDAMTQNNSDIAELNKQVVQFETKTSNLENRIMNDIDHVTAKLVKELVFNYHKERDDEQEVKFAKLQNAVDRKLAESKNESIKVLETVNRNNQEMRHLIDQVLMKFDGRSATDRELTEHDFDIRSNNIL